MGCLFSSSKEEKVPLILPLKPESVPSSTPTTNISLPYTNGITTKSPAPRPFTVDLQVKRALSNHQLLPHKKTHVSALSTDNPRLRSHSAPPTRGALPLVNIPSLETIASDIRSKWEKSIHLLPVATDFPRLARFTKIVNNQAEVDMDGLVKGVDFASVPIERVIYSFLLTLATQLADIQTYEATKEHYWKIMRENIEGEIRREFDQFLRNCLKEDSRVARVLKTINQGALAPANISLRMALPSLPFKDFRNSWRVEVVITEDLIEIIHRRREQSFNTAVDRRFEFVWECRISFDALLTILKDVNIMVTEIGFDETASEQHRADVQSAMTRFTAGEKLIITTLSPSQLVETPCLPTRSSPILTHARLVASAAT